MSFEEYLTHSLDTLSNSHVKEAMQYSLMAGGKRIRPALLFAVLKGYGIDQSVGFSVGSAIEMIHTYSLIHDDLPAMDNDTLRRGKPTCHVQFDEATAILAGDALLTQAFLQGASVDCSDTCKLQILQYLASCSGADGMILGQIKDIEGEAKPTVSIEELEDIYFYKTGKLLTLPLVCGALIAQHEETLSIWEEAGKLIGYSFQIQDDVLDVISTNEALGKNINSDASNEKTTYVSLLSVEEAQQKAKAYYDQAFALIDQIPKFDSSSIKELFSQLVYRKS